MGEEEKKVEYHCKESECTNIVSSETKTCEECEKKKTEFFLSHYVKPHTKVSKEVREKDISRVAEDAHIMYNLCHLGHGIYPNGWAVAHSQINKRKSLRFFVTIDKKLIINPVIIRHTNSFVDSKEGCLSFPDKYPITVQRWYKCEVEYFTLIGEDKMSEKKLAILKGKESFIWQHEIDHLDAKYIFEVK